MKQLIKDKIIYLENEIEDIDLETINNDILDIEQVLNQKILERNDMVKVVEDLHHKKEEYKLALEILNKLTEEPNVEEDDEEKGEEE